MRRRTSCLKTAPTTLSASSDETEVARLQRHRTRVFTNPRRASESMDSRAHLTAFSLAPARTLQHTGASVPQRCTHGTEALCCAFLLANSRPWVILVTSRTKAIKYTFSYSKEDKNDILPVNSGLWMRKLYKRAQDSSPQVSATELRTVTPNRIRWQT
jgi:hypothetical protein